MPITGAAAEVVTGHAARLAALDPWLPRAQPLAAAAPGETMFTTAGGVAVAGRERPDPDSFHATYGAAEQHYLRARVAGPDPAGALAALLDQWSAHLGALTDTGAPTADSEAGLGWPSRDPAMSQVFLAHGLTAAAVIAARPAGRVSPPAPDGVLVRPLAATDLDAATGLWLAEVRWDAQFATVVERPGTAAATRTRLSAAVSENPPQVWVGEADGEVAGLVVVSPPAQAGWIASSVGPAPVAYVDCLSVAPQWRGKGVGAALVRHVHAALDASGVAMTLLHYAVLNPLSGPFWHRCGYRPLWTFWNRRPAGRLHPPA